MLEMKKPQTKQPPSCWSHSAACLSTHSASGAHSTLAVRAGGLVEGVRHNAHARGRAEGALPANVKLDLRHERAVASDGKLDGRHIRAIATVGEGAGGPLTGPVAVQDEPSRAPVVSLPQGDRLGGHVGLDDDL